MPAVAAAERAPTHDAVALAEFRTTLTSAHEATDKANAEAADPRFTERTPPEKALIETVIDTGRFALLEAGIETASLDSEVSWSPEEVTSDITERLALPMGARRGSEVIDASTGESRKPCLEVYCSEESAHEVAESLARQEEGLKLINQLLDLIDTKVTQTNLQSVPEANMYGSTVSGMEYITKDDNQQTISDKVAKALDGSSAFHREWVKDDAGGHFALRISDDIARALVGTENSIALHSGLLGVRVEVEGLKPEVI